MKHFNFNKSEAPLNLLFLIKYLDFEKYSLTIKQTKIYSTYS